MRTDVKQDDAWDPVRAWHSQRERYHRARVKRLLLPALPPLLAIVLVVQGTVAAPTTAIGIVGWVVGSVIYGVVWIVLIKDARRFIDEAAAMDMQYRAIMGDPTAEVGTAGPPPRAADGKGPVVALAGRRIDARDATATRFPLERIGEVRQRLVDYFAKIRPSALVCSAACGADLLALDAAAELGVRCRVILPFERSRFRQTSVTDRAGNWGPLFDRVLDSLAAVDLVILEGSGPEMAAYEAANSAILEHASAFATEMRPEEAGGAPIIAVLVWDRRSRGADDLTASFAEAAARSGLPVHHIQTR